MSEMNDGTVLLVDDDLQVLDLYSKFLEDQYDVRSASNGNEALEQLDDQVDVVLLDRRMPDVSGDELLETIRKRGYQCRVGLVTAIHPDIDIVELGFDEYVVKPVSRQELRDVVELLLKRAGYDAHIQEWLALLSKKATLENELSQTELKESTEYVDLQQAIDDHAERAPEDLADLAADDFNLLFRQLDSESTANR